MDHLKKFTDFFCNLGDICFKIKMVERPIKLLDFTSEKGQVINPEYFKEINLKYPNVIKGFYMAMHRNSQYGVQIFLENDGQIILEYLSPASTTVKVVRYKSVREIQEERVSIIHFLSKEWNPIKIN